MDTNKRPMRTLSIGRAVRSVRTEEPLSPVPDGIPEHPVAPNGDSQTTSSGPSTAYSEDEVLITLLVPEVEFKTFSDWVARNIRIVAPEGLNVHIIVLPRMKDVYDPNQYARPASITIQEVVTE